jgi:hypothetical protein
MKIQFKIFTLLFLCVSASFAQQAKSVLHGQVTDSMGGALPNTTITAISKENTKFTTLTDLEGNFTFNSLPAGQYKIQINLSGFSPYENSSVEIKSGEASNLDIVLNIADTVAEVTVDADEMVMTDPAANADSLVLKDDALEALPDDGEDLVQALQMLAGPTASVEDSVQISVDGFRGGSLPPKASIREVRVNNNPFAAEYDRMGNGRVEILTKPGTNDFRGQTFFGFNDESLNSRSPFVATRAAYQSKRYGGNLSGQIIPKKASFFFDFERRGTEDNREINAIILDSSLNSVSFNQTIVAPTRRMSFTPRVDLQLNDKNTLISRYIFEQSKREGDGIGNFNLASRGYNSNNLQHTFQITETSVFNQSTFIETRLQFYLSRRNNDGGSFEPGIRVLDAFTSGGAQIDGSFNNENRFELQNFTSHISKKHSLKFGARIRWGQVENASEQNFAGTFTFGGGSAPQLDANNQIIRDQNNQPVLTTITSLERYRRTLFFQQLGFSPTQIRTYGGGATQFSILGGNPEIKYSQTDISPFFQDDWRVKSNLTVSFGIRYDWQNNIKSLWNFAPRFSFAWSPKTKKKENQKTVVRAGIGIFYDRFNESMLSQSLRYDGVNQQQFVISSSTEDGQQFLDLFPNTPTIAQLSSFLVRQTIREIDSNLQTPYTIQSAVTFERQLPYKTTLSVNFINTRTDKMFRSRNINAPIAEQNNIRPFPDQGNIYQFESSGRFRQNQLNVSVNNRLSRNLFISVNYSLTDSNSDTDGLGTFPINQYDLSSEYARSLADIRHRFTMFGSINAFWGIRLNPSFVINSGRPFNITVGRDLNRDALFTERPAFADSQTSEKDLRVTPFGNFDINPKAGQIIIPRNYGTGPSFAEFDLRINKEFRFGIKETKKDAKAKYSLNLSINIQNLTNSTNKGIPVGNLSSPLFGISNSGAGRFGSNGGSQSAGNRRIDLQARFNF